MRKLLAGCLALCIPALLTAQTPADSISRTEAIDSVVVTARRPLMVYKQTGNIAVDIEQLKYAPLFAGEKDIFKFLQLLPGVSAGKDGMSGLLVRGGSNDQTLILYDDVPIYNQAHAYGILSIFSGETVQSAEVSKGFISPAYGSPALGPDADSHTRGRPTKITASRSRWEPCRWPGPSTGLSNAIRVPTSFQHVTSFPKRCLQSSITLSATASTT